MPNFSGLLISTLYRLDSLRTAIYKLLGKLGGCLKGIGTSYLFLASKVISAVQMDMTRLSSTDIFLVSSAKEKGVSNSHNLLTCTSSAGSQMLNRVIMPHSLLMGPLTVHPSVKRTAYG